MKLFGQFVEGTDSWLSLSLMRTQEDLNGVKVPRPTDQRYSIALFFTDYFPNIPRLKFSLKGIISDGLPTTAPHLTRADSYTSVVLNLLTAQYANSDTTITNVSSRK